MKTKTLPKLRTGWSVLALITLAGCSQPAEEPSVSAQPAPSSMPAMPALEPLPASYQSPLAPPPWALPANPAAVAATPTIQTARPLSEEDMERLRYGIYMFREEHGRPPQTLAEAVAAGMIEREPATVPQERLDYDRVTGELTLVRLAQTARR